MWKLRYAVLSILSTVIVLHNSLDKASRQFVETIPPGTDVQIIDWYKDDAARYSYTGPPPSAFPTVIVPMPSDGSLGALRMPKTWHEAQTVLSAPESFVQQKSPGGSSTLARKTPCETVTKPGQYIGGQTVSEAQKLLGSSDLSPLAQKALNNALMSTGAKPQTNLAVTKAVPRKR